MNIIGPRDSRLLSCFRCFNRRGKALELFTRYILDFTRPGDKLLEKYVMSSSVKSIGSWRLATDEGIRKNGFISG